MFSFLKKFFQEPEPEDISKNSYEDFRQSFICALQGEGRDIVACPELDTEIFINVYDDLALANREDRTWLISRLEESKSPEEFLEWYEERI